MYENLKSRQEVGCELSPSEQNGMYRPGNRSSVGYRDSLSHSFSPRSLRTRVLPQASFSTSLLEMPLPSIGDPLPSDHGDSRFISFLFPEGRSRHDEKPEFLKLLSLIEMSIKVFVIFVTYSYYRFDNFNNINIFTAKFV